MVVKVGASIMVVCVKGMEPTGILHIRVFALFLRPVTIAAQGFFRTCGPWASTVGTEELGHLEMVGTIVHQLTRNLTEEQIKEAGFEPYFVDHTTGVSRSRSVTRGRRAPMQVTGDTIVGASQRTWLRNRRRA